MARARNPIRRLVSECFEATDGYWRGLGKIEGSTLRLKDKYSRFDAFKRFDVTEKASSEPKGCRCGEVLCGLIKPTECNLFGEGCSPDTPIGPCMVSAEGACSAWFKYGEKKNK